MSSPRRGFTLVELLVVIVIIGMLVALLLPAVLGGREQGRQATCMNNLKEIGTAVMSYETEKGRLPGFVNPPLSAGTNLVTWPMAILPYLGRKDIADKARYNVDNSISPVWPVLRINQYICPDDAIQSTATIVNLLSYVVPTGSPAGTTPIYFVDRNAATSSSGTQVLISQIPNPAQSIMIAERSVLDTAGMAVHAGDATRGWLGPTSFTTTIHDRFTFDCPTLNLATAARAMVTPTILTTSHPGIVIVFFFDGHADKVADDTRIKNPADTTADPTDGSLVLQ